MDAHARLVVSDELLRRDVRVLGEMLGEVIAAQEGPEALELVERVRRLARDRRSGSRAAEYELARLIAHMSLADARIVARAFSIYFDVANIAEDRHRVRVLREREMRHPQQPVSESTAAAVQDVRLRGLGPPEMRRLLEQLAIELVFTAHPSEAKRRSIRAKLRRMRTALQELDRNDLLPRERSSLRDTIHAELSVLWQTEFLHPNRPHVLDEVDRGVATLTRLWEVVPSVFQSVRQALELEYPGVPWSALHLLSFGFWMGGDRDGNPRVNWETTQQTLCRLRSAAIRLHLEWSLRLSGYLTISPRDPRRAQRMKRQLDAAAERWPGITANWRAVDPGELHRRWLLAIQWRLTQSFAENLDGPLPDGAYRDGPELLADIQWICDELIDAGDSLPLEQELRRWRDLASTFGLHLARLDIRQGSPQYQAVAGELLVATGECSHFATLGDPERILQLTETLQVPFTIEEERLSSLARDTLGLHRLLHRAVTTFGMSCVGGSVVSLTRQASDALIPLWLWRRTAATESVARRPWSDADIPVVPLFEQIDDLRHAAETLIRILANPTYRESVRRQGNRQWIMIGYSDSTKDGGYVAANWGLYEAQRALHDAARPLGIAITFFHGRGGALGRGGGPAARGIQSLPPQSLDGTLRLTEQGEVLAERYDDPQIAYRHLEQVIGAVLTSSSHVRQPPPLAWTQMMSTLAQMSRRAYRELVEEPSFIDYFETATPIEEIEDLPIASRPARRLAGRQLTELRAIPWVFAWTQNRSLIPAWYGLGTALATRRDQPDSWQMLQVMYRDWPFFEAMIENASLALAKSDMYIAHQYSLLLSQADRREPTWKRIEHEFQLARQTVLDLTGRQELLANIPWFQRSIEVRNPYVDPLNLIQIEFLRRRRRDVAQCLDACQGVEQSAETNSDDAIRDLLRLTVQGIAAGMRTTG